MFCTNCGIRLRQIEGRAYCDNCGVRTPVPVVELLEWEERPEDEQRFQMILDGCKDFEAILFANHDGLYHARLANVKTDVRGMSFDAIILPSFGFTESDYQRLACSAPWKVLSFTPTRWNAPYISWSVYLHDVRDAVRVMAAATLLKRHHGPRQVLRHFLSIRRSTVSQPRTGSLAAFLGEMLLELRSGKAAEVLAAELCRSARDLPDSIPLAGLGESETCELVLKLAGEDAQRCPSCSLTFDSSVSQCSGCVKTFPVYAQS